MQKLTSRSLGLYSVAIALALTTGACSDNSASNRDAGGKADGPTGGVDVVAHDAAGGGADLAVPDVSVAGPDVAQPDVAGPDVAQPDAAVADLRTPDAALPDAPTVTDLAKDSSVKDTSIVDSAPDAQRIDGAIDSTVVDGGNSLVARGRYLVDNVIACSDCHTPKLPSGAPDMTRYLAGNPIFVQLPDGSALPSKNLTPDPTTGLGLFTDDQIKHMFMDGLVPGVDGGTTALNSTMPYYVFHNMASGDADAIVAYLRSVPAVTNSLPPRSPAFEVATPASYLDPSTIPTPATTYPQRDSALRGRYLATESGLCIECHTQHPASGPNAIDPAKYFQGGEDFSQLFVGTLNIHPVSANLTSDPTTGLGNWTADQIVTVLLQGKDDQGAGICPPMPVGPNGAYGGLSAQDALDIANYIKSLPPAVNDVPDMCSWPPQPALDGGAADGQPLDGLASVDSSSPG